MTTISKPGAHHNDGSICEDFDIENLVEDVLEDEELVAWCLNWAKAGGGWQLTHHSNTEDSNNL